jgi:tetratricopeptide (TPR) repeat protein
LRERERAGYKPRRMSATACYRHPAIAATRSCGDCFQPICGVCSILEEERCRCPECSAAKLRNWKRRMVLSLGLGGVVIALGVGYLAWRGAAPAPAGASFDYGPKRAAVAALRAQLDQEPCDRGRAVQYAQTLFSAEDWRGSIRFTDDFIARCGKFPQLRSISYSAHMRLSEFEPASQDATELVDSAPNNASYRVWRALAHQSRGASEQALGDFQEAFRLQPEQFQVANQLATTYERLHQPCEAHRVLTAHLRTRRPAPQDPELMGRIALLEAEGHCGAGGKVDVSATKPGKR